MFNWWRKKKEGKWVGERLRVCMEYIKDFWDYYERECKKNEAERIEKEKERVLIDGIRTLCRKKRKEWISSVFCPIKNTGHEDCFLGCEGSLCPYYYSILDLEKWIMEQTRPIYQTTNWEADYCLVKSRLEKLGELKEKLTGNSFNLCKLGIHKGEI